MVGPIPVVVTLADFTLLVAANLTHKYLNPAGEPRVLPVNPVFT
jgi:hypothetical protein